MVRHVNTRPDASFFLPGTDGVKIHTGLTPLPGEDVLVKHAPNSFYRTGLADRFVRKRWTNWSCAA